MNNQDSLEINVVNEIGKEKITELTTDYAELGLDFFIDNESLKDVPVFGTFYKIFKTASSIKDQIFLKKLYAFLFHLKDIPKDKRAKFIENLNKSEKSKQQIGQKLLLLIEKLDDFDKPKILSNLLKATIEEKITYDVFLTLANIVCNSYIGDLKELSKKINLPMDTKERLYNTGIFSLVLKKIDSKLSRTVSLQRGRVKNSKQALIELDKPNQNNSPVIKVLGGNKERVVLEIDFEITKLGNNLKKYGLEYGS